MWLALERLAWLSVLSLLSVCRGRRYIFSSNTHTTGHQQHHQVCVCPCVCIRGYVCVSVLFVWLTPKYSY